MNYLSLFDGSIVAHSAGEESIFGNHITQIRTIEDHGELWFVAQDISDALGYRNAEQLVRGLDEDEKGTRIVCTPGGKQQMLTLSESGLYHALFLSRRPDAKAFRRWVTKEVLPSIRKYGEYVANPKSVRREFEAYALSADKRVGRAIRLLRDTNHSPEAQKNYNEAYADIHRIVEMQNTGMRNLISAHQKLI